jgi:hypothetical protein
MVQYERLRRAKSELIFAVIGQKTTGPEALSYANISRTTAPPFGNGLHPD